MAHPQTLNQLEMNEERYHLLRSDRRSGHTEHIVSSLTPSPAVIATWSAILRSSSAVTECAYSPPWVVGLASCLATPRGGVSNVKSYAFCPLGRRLLASINRYGCAVLCASVGVQSFRGLPEWPLPEIRGFAHFRAVIPGFSKACIRATPFAPREGIEPPNVAEYRAMLSQPLMRTLPFRSLSSKSPP